VGNGTLVLSLAGLMVVPCAQAEESKWPSSSLEQRAAERGPIRMQVEAALTVSAGAITAQEADEARRQARGSSSSSSTRSRIPWGVWVLVGLLSLCALLAEWGRGWSNM